MRLDTQLGQLEAAQLVRRAPEEEPAYWFKHALTQETAYESLLVKKRREIHRRVAACIERLDADRLDEYAAILAQHYAQAGDDAKTLEYAARAGDAAMRVYANAEAVAHYSLALEAAKRAARPAGISTVPGERGAEPGVRDLYLKRGRALELLSHFDEAARNYAEMEALAHTRGDRAFELAALIACATIRAIPGSARDEEHARVYANQALALAGELGDRAAQAKILWIMLLLSIYTNVDAQEAVQYGEQSLAIARELNLREQMAFTLHDLYVAYTYLGDLDKARAVRVESGQLWRELGNLPLLAESIGGLAILDFLLGQFDQALSLAQEGFKISESINNIGGQGFSGYVLGLIYLERGEIAHAIQSLQEAIPITEFGGLGGNGIDPHGMLGVIYAALGDTNRALQVIRVGLDGASARLHAQRMWLYALRTRVELRAGNLEAAEQAFREGAVVASLESFEQMFPPAAPDPYFAAGELELARQEYTRAGERMDGLLPHLRRVRFRFAIPYALYLKAQALRGQDRVDEACQALREGRAEAEAMGTRRNLWPILAALSEMETARGDQNAANLLRAQAREIVEYIVEHTPLDPVTPPGTSLRETFLNSPDVRSILQS